MNPYYPINLYRTEKAADGEGGWTETLGSPTVIYGAMNVHSNEPSVIFESLEDVREGDLITVANDIHDEQAAVYRVMEIDRMPGLPRAKAKLARQTQPIEPLRNS